ncbi:MAG: hypothetical protein HEQ35_14725 [Gloeotrichia echinulata IR180]
MPSYLPTQKTSSQEGVGMATDYILFIHGVTIREDHPEQPVYADPLFKRLQESPDSRQLVLKKVPLYWGDVNEKAEDKLRKQFQASPLWNDMWFRTFREQQILEFTGDAALYISRHVGSQVANTLRTQAVDHLKNANSHERLHLVTHSWGTVILFDILFAGRWDYEDYTEDKKKDLPGYEDVKAIREVIFGIGSNPNHGVKIASIHTMGSPVAIFNLTNVQIGKDSGNSPSGFDITPNLQKLLESLQKVRNGKKLPWRNYIHPGDPIAYPLNELMTDLVDGDKQYLDIQDILTQEAGLLDSVTAQTLLPILHGGDAHGSYWQNEKVVQEINRVLK